MSWEPDARSFVVDVTTNDRDPCIVPLTDILLQRLLDKLPVDGNTPGNIQSAGREEGRGGIDSIFEDVVWSSTKAL